MFDAVGKRVDARRHWQAFIEKRPWHAEALAALAGISLVEYRAKLSHLRVFGLIREKFPTRAIRTVFDVGANEGQSCIPYSQVLPNANIYAFEPVPATFESLLVATRGHENIFAHNIALSSENGTLEISAAGTSTMNRVRAGARRNGVVEIQAQTVEDFCCEYQISHVDFLKIDTEGHDLAVLQGCGDFVGNIDFVQCETSANRYNRFHNGFVEIFNFMSDAGFYLFQIEGQTFEWGNGGYPILRRFDPVFVNSRVVGLIEGVIVE
jgi:FkbM family methyltransferase